MIDRSMFLSVLVMNKGISDHGHFVQCLTSLLINSPTVELTDQCLDFYRSAFDHEETEVTIHSIEDQGGSRDRF